MNITQFNHKKDIVSIGGNNTIRAVITGKTRAGKTYFAKHLIQQIAHEYSHIFVITGNHWQYKEMEKDLPATKLVYFKSSDVKEICGALKYIKQQRLAHPHDTNRNGKPIYKKKWMIIMDDVMDAKLSKQPAFSDLFFSFRHYDTSVIFIAQACYTFITPAVRAQCSHFFFFKTAGQQSRRFAREIMQMHDDIQGKNDSRVISNICNSLLSRYIDKKQFGGICYCTDTSELRYI